MKKFALLYGIIATLLWLFLLVYLLIGFKDLAKDSHKTILKNTKCVKQKGIL